MPTQKPQAVEKWYSIRAAERPSDSAKAAAEILIYGDIGESWYGETIAAADFVREVSALDVTEMTIRINSYGGSVSDGIAIFNALKRHPANVTTVVDGVAASIASLIAVAGDTVQMAENATMMLHAPWGGIYGNSAELRQYADMLDTWAGAMATSYAAKTGTDKAEILSLLTDGLDHWYTAEEALAANLVDTVVSAIPIAASASLMPQIKARFTAGARQAPVAAAAVNMNANPKENQTMAGTQTAAGAPAAAAPAAVTSTDDVARAAADAALAADKDRRAGIAAAFAPFSSTEGVSALLTACADDQQCTVEKANAKLLVHLGSGAAPAAGGYIVTLEDARDKFKAGAQAALMARAKLDKDDRANNFRSYSLLDIARECLAHAGVNSRGMDKMAVVAAAFTHGASDFPLLLANVANKAMMMGYEEADETFPLWTSKGTLPDFKVGKRVDLNTFPGLDQIQDGAEYRYADFGERGESVQLATYGKLFNLTRATIINDDLDAFSKIPKRMGRAAVRTVGDLVYAVLTSNPPMADGVALFHANHKNLLTGAAISTGAVDAMQVAMATQKDGTGNTLNIAMAKLLVPFALRGSANVVRNSEYEVGAASRNNTTPNSVRETFEVIADARLDNNSATTWYGVADSGMNDTIEVSYLDGIETPTLETQNGWTVDGVEFKVRLDAGVKALDFRTMAKNPGA